MAQVHYYTDNRDLPENRKEHVFHFLGNQYRFITDAGVFSKTEIDYGSYVLLKSVSDEDLHGDVLDMGCGYGVIGIVTKCLFPDTDVTCVDVNPRAVELTGINSGLNNVRINSFVSNQFEQVERSFDCVLTNPPIRAGKATVYGIFEGAYSHLRENGTLLVVIRRQQGAESAKKKLIEIFGNCELVTKDKGYWILKCVK